MATPTKPMWDKLAELVTSGKLMHPEKMLRGDWDTMANSLEPMTSAATVQRAQEENRKRNAARMLDAIIDCQEQMDMANVPDKHREIHMTRQQFDTMRHILERGHPAARGQMQSVPRAGAGYQSGQVMGMPVYVDDEQGEKPPLEQEAMDDLASTLTEAVLLLRAGDERGAMAKLKSADWMCGVRISPPIQPREKTAAEIRAKQNSVMYGKSMVSALAEAQKAVSLSMVNKIDSHITDAMTYGVGMMEMPSAEAELKQVQDMKNAQARMRLEALKMQVVPSIIMDDEQARKALVDLNIGDVTQRGRK